MNIKNRGKALHKATLSERIRPNSEAAPWVIDEIKTMEKELCEAKIDVDRLNEMLRRTGYGQGQIDAYAAQCEETDRLKTEVERLQAEIKLQNKDWCDDDEAIKQQALRVLPKEIVDGDSFHVPRMGGLAELMADEIEKLKKENEQLRKRIPDINPNTPLPCSFWTDVENQKNELNNKKKVVKYDLITTGDTGCEMCNGTGYIESKWGCWDINGNPEVNKTEWYICSKCKGKGHL